MLGLSLTATCQCALGRAEASYHGNIDKAGDNLHSNSKRDASVPTLAQMTESDRSSEAAARGFFLQVEGASIDKQDHAANPCGQIGETVDLDDEAVQKALEFAKRG